MVIQRPIVSEKSAMVTEKNNQYVFRVLPDANKREVKKAVEQLFEVKVKEVRVLNVKGKRKRFGGRMGQRSDWRKAYVRLHPEYHIDFGGGA